MDLFVQTLTGTLFELRVSPFETILSIKGKVQRLEGKPFDFVFFLLFLQNMPKVLFLTTWTCLLIFVICINV